MRYIMYWIRVFLRQKAFRKQMEEYVMWRARRYPTTTDSHREYLYRFAVHTGKAAVQQIDREDVLGFINGLQGEYQRQLASRIIMGFLAFHGLGEWYEVKDKAVKVIKRRIGRPVNLKMVHRVKELKDRRHMSFRLIQRQLLDEEERKYGISQIHNWYHHRE